jgi:hypothetical protein
MEQKFGTKIKSAAEAKNPITAEIETGTYAQIFAYCIPKKNHAEMKDVATKLSKIYQRHRSLGMKLYVWGQSTIFQGFTGIQKQLGANPDDEVWIEVDSYKMHPTSRKS